jgi:hypothetical protein
MKGMKKPSADGLISSECRAAEALLFFDLFPEHAGAAFDLQKNRWRGGVFTTASLQKKMPALKQPAFFI